MTHFNVNIYYRGELFRSSSTETSSFLFHCCFTLNFVPCCVFLHIFIKYAYPSSMSQTMSCAHVTAIIKLMIYRKVLQNRINPVLYWQTRLSLVCEVITYRLVQVWQNLKKIFWVASAGPRSPFFISSSFILFVVLLPFLLKTKIKFYNTKRRWKPVNGQLHLVALGSEESF